MIHDDRRTMHTSLLFHFLLFCVLTQLSVSFAPHVPRRLRRSDCQKMISQESTSDEPISSAGLTFSQADPALQASRWAAFERLKTTVQSLAEFGGSENVKLIRTDGLDKDATATVIPINSLLFQVTSLPDPILVIAPSSVRVDIKKLQAYLEQADDDERISVFLTSADKVEQLCGFPPQSVPPLGHIPRSIRTLVDMQLVQQEGAILLGGGGHPSIGCRVAVETLLKLEGMEVADIGSGYTTTSESPIQHQGLNSDMMFLKPFFSVAPPDTETAEYILQNPDKPNPLKPQPVTIIGRINGVRRMAHRLVFCDLAPPNYVGSGSKLDSYDLPWKSGVDEEDMGVQLIAGKTFCKNRGDIKGPALLKNLKPGQLVLVEGITNVGNRESVGHWVEKRSFDIIVSDYRLLEEAALKVPPVPPPAKVKVKPSVDSSAELRRLQLSGQVPEPTTVANSINYLKLSDIFERPIITMVDSLESIDLFAQALTSLSSGEINGDSSPVSMVGVDCEWKPSFMISPSEPQPVLLLQISLQKLQTVYLLDLQTLFRPCRQPSEAMNELESVTSAVLAQLFASTHFLKIGFQLMTDLRRLAGSYPHVNAFRIFHAVIEVSGIAKKIMLMAKIRKSRELTTSLSRLTQYLLDRPLDKEQQISDWSRRPLVAQQEEYASLDAAVLPILFQKSLQLADVDWLGDGLKLGRRKDDASFLKSIIAIRFLSLDSDDPVAVRKLKAKKIVSDQYIVTQSWIEGAEEPYLPSIPSNGEGPYTDVSGILRMPSLLVGLKSSANGSMMTNLIGQRLGKSKDSCLQALLNGNADLPEGTKLEYHQRSGYVEFADGIALFVNMPVKAGDPSPRGYPNAWLKEGRSMTWFLRDDEWNHGTSQVAKKLLESSINGESLNPQRAILFVRMGRGEFICCGRCRAAQLEASEMTRKDVKDWGLVEVCLELLDWNDLQNFNDFTSMACDLEEESDTTVHFQKEVSPSELARKIIKGDVVGAMGLALLDWPVHEKSVEVGLEQLKQVLRTENGTPEIKTALENLEELISKFI